MGVRQLIARIDDDLHDRLKARAAAEGRSLNALVAEVLSAAVAPTNASVRAELARRGRLVVPPVSRRPPGRAAALRATQGSGSAGSEALAEDRARR